jgi:hypothetical protein
VHDDYKLCALLCLQLDLEMSWMDRDSIMGLMEQMVATVFKQVGKHSSHIMVWRFRGEGQPGTPGQAMLILQPCLCTNHPTQPAFAALCRWQAWTCLPPSSG